MDKVRPVLIVSNDHDNQHRNAVLVAAITSTIPAKSRPTAVGLDAGAPLPRPGTILCSSLYTLPKDELGSFRFGLSESQMRAVDRALAAALQLPRPAEPPTGR